MFATSYTPYMRSRNIARASVPLHHWYSKSKVTKKKKKKKRQTDNQTRFDYKMNTNSVEINTHTDKSMGIRIN